MTQMPSEQPEEDEGERMETDASSAGGASRFALVLPLRVFRKPRNGQDDGRRGVPVWKLLTPPPPLFGDFPPSVRRENLLYYPPTSEPF